MRRFLLFCLLLLLALAAPAARAQDALPNPIAQLDAAKSALDQVEAALGRTDLSDATLQDLRAQVDPVGADLQAVVAELTPRLDAAKARLAQLGPKPDPKAPPEAPAITAERAAQGKLFDDLDATVKRAKVLAVQSAQLDARIVAKRRDAFARSVLTQSDSLLDPRLWVPVATEWPADMGALGLLARDWWDGPWARLNAWQRTTALVLLAAVVAAYLPVRRVALRLTARDARVDNPTRLRRVTAALWITVVLAVLPVALALLAGAVLRGFDLITPRLEPIAAAVLRGAIVVGLNVGLARGFLSPRATHRRLPPISDFGAERLYRLAIVVSAAVAMTRVMEALNEAIAVGLPTAVASRGVLAGIATAGIGVALRQLGSPEGAASARAVRKTGRDWSGPLRLLFWLLFTVLSGALLAGFVAFASFLVLQIVACSVIGILLFLLLALTDEGTAAGFEPNRALGRLFIQNFGMRRDALDQIGILLAGAVRVALITVAVLLVLAPWRIESGDAWTIAKAAFFGFSVGDVTISLSAVAVALVLFLLGIAVTRGVQRWLEVKFLPHTRLDTGLQNSIKTSLGYVGVLVAVSLGLSQLGLSFERLAIVAGALSVGIGFGLQSIVNNFVSGLILLWERAIRVGDWVVVGDEQGYVKRINVRSTEIETFDRATIIVPNSNLVSGVVKNWLRNDHVGRVRIPFSIGIGQDPEQVREILVAAAKEHEHVLSIPAPQVIFSALGDTAMKLELQCFIEDIESAARVTSDLLFTVTRRFRETGLIAPPAPPTVTSPALEKLDAWLSGREADRPKPRRAANT